MQSLFSSVAFIESDTDIRQRHIAAGNSAAEEDVDTVIRHHAEMQERIAEEMLHLARNLKENAKASGQIVRDDNQVSWLWCNICLDLHWGKQSLLS